MWSVCDWVGVWSLDFGPILHTVFVLSVCMIVCGCVCGFINYIWFISLSLFSDALQKVSM